MQGDSKVIDPGAVVTCSCHLDAHCLLLPTTAQVMEKANTTLEVAVDILELLIGITENVPYLSIITDCVKRLLEIHKVVLCCVRYVY
jgi:hypothetical protein